MAAALGEAIGPRALARRNAHFLREEAFCSRHAAIELHMLRS